MTSSTKRLVVLLQRLSLEVPPGLKIQRVRAGRHQRSAGAWSWVGVDDQNMECVASQWPVHALVRPDASVEVYYSSTHGIPVLGLVHDEKLPALKDVSK